MKDRLKTVFPACLGSSVAVTAVEYFRHIGVWGIGDLLFNFILTFIITEIIVTIAFLLWGQIKKKKK